MNRLVPHIHSANLCVAHVDLRRDLITVLLRSLKYVPEILMLVI